MTPTPNEAVEAALDAWIGPSWRDGPPAAIAHSKADMRACFAAADAKRWRPRPLAEWHEGIGNALWWRFPVSEAPYVGAPLDLGHTVELHTHDGPEPRIAARATIGGWPGYHTHWTPLRPLPSPPKDIPTDA